MSENRCRSERRLEIAKRLSGGGTEIPLSGFMGEPNQRCSEGGVEWNEPSVEVGEAEEGLNVLDVPRLGPIDDCLDLILRHVEAFRRKHVTQVLDSVCMKLTLVGTSVKTVFSEPSEDFSHVFRMVVRILGVDEDVV